MKMILYQYRALIIAVIVIGLFLAWYTGIQLDNTYDTIMEGLLQ